MKISDIEMPDTAFIYGAIHLLANRMQAIGDKIDPDISTKQWFVLAVVTKYGETPPNIGDVANALGTSRQNIKKIAAILERHGFLRLERKKDDKRTIQLFLTEQCRTYLKGREQQENEYLEKIFSGFTHEALAGLRKGLNKLIVNMEKILN